jgi:intracellular sulfur oxidation DsrE/DsrF family protein
VALPHEETLRRWEATTVQWPIMHTVFYGIDRNQMMARHKSNHIQVVYANSAADADSSLLAKAAMADAMGMEVAVCGTKSNGKKWTE